VIKELIQFLKLILTFLNGVIYEFSGN